MKTMSEKVGPMGGNMGGTFDDGVFDGVKKIIVGKDIDSNSYIKIEYEKDGKFETREHGTSRGELKEFTVDYPNEYITSVGGSYEHVSRYGTVLIKSLSFKTSYGRTSPILGHTRLCGNPAGTKFMLEGKNGGKLLGFHGRCGQALDAIGPHFFAVNSPLKHFNRQGGNGGRAWDDGAFDGVRKILVGRSGSCVSYLRFEYAKGERMVPHAHGKIREVPQEFVVDYPNEHITSVEGTIAGYLTSIKFKTSKGRTSPAFGNEAFGNVLSKKFVFEEKGFKLVGFCGRSGDAIDALGAHFAPLPPPAPAPAPAPAPVPAPAPPAATTKMGPLGGNKGNTFEDGVFDGVKKITVGADQYSITYIKIEYEKDGKVQIREHGTNRGELKEFSVAYPNDYITAVGGSYNHIYNYDTTLIKSLYFTTSKGFTSPLFGETKGTEFEFKGENGGKLLGFHGRAGYAIDALGVHFSSSTSSLTPPNKENHNKMSKIYISSGNGGIEQIKFYNVENGEKKERFVHCVKGKNIISTFLISNPPDEYLVSVESWYDSSNVFQGIKFKTDKNTSDFFGYKFSEDDGTPFSLQVKDKKIMGVHKFADSNLSSPGTYFVLKLHGKWIQVEQKDKGPGPRCSHAIAMVGNKLYSFGGELTPNFPIDRDLYVFDFKTQRWSIAPPNGHVPELPCLGVSMVAVGTTLYVFGGRDGKRNYNGFYSYDTVKSEWKLITHVNKGPTPRSFHAMAADDKNIYIFGGVSATVRVNTLHAYNIVDQKWIELPNPGESCQGRGGSGLAVVQGKIWVVYGFIGDEVDEVHCFDPVESKWTKVETSGEKPSARSVFATAVVGKHIIISGGEIEMDPQAHLGPGKLHDGLFVLDTESLMWEKLEKGHSPRGWCASTTASIDGKKGLLMYGGKAPTNGRYDDIFFYGVDSA